MKVFYQEIRKQIEDNTSVQHVRLWNNQINLSEKGEQIPFQFPAVFIDFPYMQWSQVGKGVQTCQLTIRLYIVFESFITAENEEDVEIFDLRDEVYLAVTDPAFVPTNAKMLMRISEQTDPNHTNTYVWTMDFNTTFTETIGITPRGNVSAEINTLNLDTDLIIDPNTVDGVRTDKDFE